MSLDVVFILIKYTYFLLDKIFILSLLCIRFVLTASGYGAEGRKGNTLNKVDVWKTELLKTAS